MPDQTTNLVRIHLKSIDELFAEPEADSFDPQTRYLSGIDEIANQLRLQHLGNPSRIEIALRSDAIDPEHQALIQQALIQQALDRYCAHQIESNQQALAALRVERRGTLAYSLLIILIAVAIGVVISFMSFLPAPIQWLFIALISILFWITLWTTADLFLYAWRPFKQEIRLYENIRRAELAFEPHP